MIEHTTKTCESSLAAVGLNHYCLLLFRTSLIILEATVFLCLQGLQTIWTSHHQEWQNVPPDQDPNGA